MKARLLTFAALSWAATAMAGDWVAPSIEDLVKTEPVAGGLYYIYNEGAGQYLCGANAWETQASVKPANEALTFLLTYEELADGTMGWGIKNQGSKKFNKYLFFDGPGGSYIDMGSQNAQHPNCNFWNITATGDGTYTIQIVPSCDRYVEGQYFGWDGSEKGIVVPDLDENSEEGSMYWSFLDAAVYVAKQALYNKLNEAEEAGVSTTAAEAVYNTATTAEELNAAMEVLAARTALFKKINESAEAGVNTAAAEEVYNNSAASAEELNAAVEVLAARTVLFNKISEANDLEINTEEVEAVYNNSEATVEELNAASLSLKYEIIAAKYPEYAKIEAGDYLLQNVATGQYLCGANNWGTQASLANHGILFTIEQLDNGCYTLDSHTYNGAAQHFLGGNLFVDADATPWVIKSLEEGIYTLTADDGVSYMAAPEEGNVMVAIAEASEAAQWKIISASEVIANIQPGTDVTFLIKNASISRNLYRTGFEPAWTVSENCYNSNLGGGKNEQQCAESYHSPFDIYQVINNVPNGTYQLTAQAFYRQDGEDEENMPVVYANNETKPFPEKTGTENSMSEASDSFAQGLYTIDPITVIVNDGTLRVGVKSDNATMWCIWDNFELTYVAAPLEVATAYNEDNSACVVSAQPAQEGTALLLSIDGGNEFMELPAEGYTVAWTPGKADEWGICVFDVVVREVVLDAEYNVTAVLAEGYEQVRLAEPLPVLEIATAYNEDNSTCVVTAEPTEEGTEMLISIDGGEEFMELPAEGYVVAWTPGLADEDGVCVFDVIVYEVKVTVEVDEETGEEITYKEIIVEGTVQVSLNKPLVDNIAGISVVKENKAMYDLSGRRVEKAVKGIYIANGKKVVVK